jgi:hypothetical protein
MFALRCFCSVLYFYLNSNSFQFSSHYLVYVCHSLAVFAERISGLVRVCLCEDTALYEFCRTDRQYLKENLDPAAQCIGNLLKCVCIFEMHVCSP